MLYAVTQIRPGPSTPRLTPPPSTTGTAAMTWEKEGVAVDPLLGEAETTADALASGATAVVTAAARTTPIDTGAMKSQRIAAGFSLPLRPTEREIRNRVSLEKALRIPLLVSRGKRIGPMARARKKGALVVPVLRQI